MLSTLLSFAVVPALAQALDTAQDSGLLRFPIRVSEGAPVVKNITKRQNEIALESQQTGFFYSIDIELGTPGQVVSVNFDTGSAELWVNPVCSKASDPEFCASFPRFTESSTVVDLGAQNHIVYGTGYADIEYVHDYVTIGSAKITQQIFGVAYDSSFSSVGILGAGPDINGWDAPYNLVIDNLLEQGFINSRAFSLDIQSINSAEGAVIYGGLDTKKFSGPLEKLPIVPASESPDGNTRFWVTLDGINLKQDDGSVDQIFEGSQTVLLDSGYTLSGFPTAIFQKFLAAFPSAKAIPGSNQYEVDCDVANLDGAVDFIFGGTTIKVPYSEFIWQQPQNNICVLGAFEDNTLPVLGDSFLRAAYVVYDWDNREIHLASSKNCGSNLIAIGSGPDAVPSQVGECGGSQTSTTSELPTSTSTTSELPTSTTSTTSELPTSTTSTTSELPTSTSTSTSKTETQSESETETETASTSESTTNSGTQTTDASSSIVTSASSSYVPTTFSSTVQSSSRYYNSSSTHGHTTYAPTLTSTITTTNVYTITSCPPQVTNCPIGSITTEVVTAYTTYCPVSKTTKPPKVTSTFTQTRVHTVTSCPGKIKCTASLSTEVITTTALVCPPTTATYTLHRTVTCHNAASGCSEGTTTYDHVVTVKPGTKNPVPTPVPGCSTCAPHNNATATWYPTGNAPTTHAPTYAAPTSESTEPAVVTAAASWNGPGILTAIIGFILAVAI